MIEFLKRIWRFIVSIPQDKLLHDYAGALITLYGFVLSLAFLPFWWALFAGDALAFAALIGKEAYDKAHPKEQTAEGLDVLYGLFGILKVDIALLLLAISVL